MPAGYFFPLPSIKLEVVVNASVTLYKYPRFEAEGVGRDAKAILPDGVIAEAISDFSA